jgi:uncharacterized protein (DUF2384 family)
MASSPQFRATKEQPIEEVLASGLSREMTRYRALVSRTVDVFGDEVKASRWLSLPNRDLGGKTPLQAVQNSGYDIQVLEPILIRIEHGIDY